MKNLIARAALTAACLFFPMLAAAHGGGEHGDGKIVVNSVHPGSPAEAAGLEADDLFVRLDGQEIATNEDLRRVMAAHRPGDTVPLTVERKGETIELALTFGERPEGGVSIGVSLAIMSANVPDLAPGEGLTRDECLTWVDETYQIDPMIRDLGLELSDDAGTLHACLKDNVQAMPSPMPTGWCDNAFKIHCSGLDLLTEIGETLVERCGKLLGQPLGSCAAQKVFDSYSRDGEASDEAACRAARDSCSEATWTQFGGPGQDFRAPARDLAESWPEAGPAKLWSRDLGDGYSAILYRDGRLYTMHRADDGTGERESVICLDAGSGETVWEERYEASYEGLRGYGIGPRSTPVIAGDLLFAVGVTGKMHALEAKGGTVLWSRELWGEEFGGNRPGHGYSSSPVAWEDTVIVSVGGKNASLVAFEQKTGKVRWRAHSFKNSYSSPRIARIAGQPQLLAFMGDELIGVDPDTGALLWRYPHSNQWHQNIAMPLANGGVDGDMIFISSPQAGAKGLRLSRDDETIRVEEAWHTRRIQLYHGSAVSSGDWVYGSTGVTAPAFMAAVNVRTGEIGWRQRGFAKANVVLADGKLVILDEEGVLYLATATPEALVVHARTQLLDRVAWTAPTIVGQTLYVRDRNQILAVDLG
ncbi:MAG: PQQ-binding-like beta-propeller repeat protein [bacterium]|nr:PQQ-binding-like beta-propeller repeat protein [bacterium]